MVSELNVLMNTVFTFDRLRRACFGVEDFGLREVAFTCIVLRANSATIRRQFVEFVDGV